MAITERIKAGMLPADALTAEASKPSMSQHRLDEVAEKGCPSQKLLQMIGDKWTLLILHKLNGRTIRYLQLQREISGISQKMLSQTLFLLERHGLVRRQVYAVVPPRVEYSLTDLGDSLVPRLWPLLEWCEDNHQVVEQAKLEYDIRRNQPE